jgi:hypothetical protein
LATGSTGRETRAAAKLLEGSQVAQLTGGGGGGKVRGVVARVPARAVNTAGGSLSREEILKVVNAGIRRHPALLRARADEVAGPWTARW